MIHGMTGFGRAAVQSSQGKASVEVKSINHRYFELIAHLPPHFNLFEERIRKEIQKQIKRGRVIFSLTFSQYAAPTVSINKRLAKHYLNQLKQLSKELKLKDNVTLQQIASFEGVVTSGNLQQASEAFWPLIKDATRAALNHLVGMRKAEGKSIYSDINNKLIQAGRLAKAISRRRHFIWQEKKKQLLPDDFYIFSKDHDINEEITRLKFHLNSLKKQLHSSGAVGKELDFISQELQREVNTIGAKLPDKKISHYVIKTKSLIEQIREQLQNTE